MRPLTCVLPATICALALGLGAPARAHSGTQSGAEASASTPARGPATLRPRDTGGAPTGESSDGSQTSDPEALERAANERTAESAALAARADAVATEIARLQADLVDAARRLSASERRAGEIETLVAASQDSEASLVARLREDRDAFAEALGALQRLQRARPPAIATTRGDAVAAARASGLANAITAAVEARIARTRADISTLLDVRAQLISERDALTRADQDLDAQRAAVAALVAEKQSLADELRAGSQEAAAAAQALAAQAQSLRDLVAALRRAADAPARIRPPVRNDGAPTPRLRPDPFAPRPLAPELFAETSRFGDARGLLAAPVEGALALPFTSDHEGVTFRTRRRAQVASPFDARIEFAGEFRGYGQMLILSVGDGYHLILAGMETLYGEVGQLVLAGEPVGAMADRRRPPPEFYFELRKDGEPIDPGPWLRT